MAVIHDEDRIILTGDASLNFVRNVLLPDKEMVARREAYRPILEKNRIEIKDGCVVADIPDLDIPDEIGF